jgi:peptidoglycan/xylan/chitin deacetylase (PgdA/CDA1 family)
VLDRTSEVEVFNGTTWVRAVADNAVHVVGFAKGIKLRRMKAGAGGVPVQVVSDVSGAEVRKDMVAGILRDSGGLALRPWLLDTNPESHRVLRTGRSAVGWSLVNNGATATMSVVANSPFGGPALRIVIPNDAGNVDLIADDLGLTNFTAGVANLIHHVFVEDELGIKQWQVTAGNDTALTRNLTNTYNLSNNNLNRANGHHVVSLNPDNATANTLLSTDTVQRLRLRFFAQPAGAVVWVGGVVVPSDLRSMLVITVDDSDVSMFTRFHQELKARGLRGTFAVDWNNVGTNPALFVSQAQLQEMYEYGHDICSHNRTNTAYPDENPPTAQPNDAARLTYCTDFRFTRNTLRELGWVRALGYHPFVQGAHDGALVDAMKAHGASVMRTTGPGNVEPYRADLQSVFRQRQLGDAFSLATARGWVDSAKARRQDIFAMGHILADTASSSITWAQADFASWLDYALDQDLLVGSVSEWGNERGVLV